MPNPPNLSQLELDACAQLHIEAATFAAAKSKGPAELARVLGLPTEYVDVAQRMGVDPAAVALNRRRTAPAPTLASAQPTRGIVFGAPIPIFPDRK